MAKRAVGAWLTAGLLLGAGLGGCGPESPVVGEETGPEAQPSPGGSGGSGGSPGSVDLIGSANFFATSFTGSEFSPEELCFPWPLPVGSGGDVQCVLFKARIAEQGECRCDDPGSRLPSDGARRLVEDELEVGAHCGTGTSVDCSDYCICEEPPATGASAADCLTSREPSPSSYGWCYINDRGRGAPELVENCHEGQKRKIRILPRELSQEPGSQFVLACSGGALLPGTAPAGSAPVGAPCIPAGERLPDASGAQLGAVEIDFGSVECASNVCLVNHFQGRVSCPYGQAPDDGFGYPRCFLPGTDEPVTVLVDPQLVARQADDAVMCSCRCDGPDPNAHYCTCPSGMECAPVVRDIGVPDSDGFVGSYCIPQGTAFDPLNLPPADWCRSDEMNCGDPRPY